MLTKLRREIRAQANAKQAKILAGFFKTGPGHYGEGDRFLGIKVPVSRKIAKEYTSLSLDALETLIQSSWHEERFIALVILVNRFAKANHKEREEIGEWYLAHLYGVNNWDLVDVTAPHIFGALAHTSSKWRKKRDTLSKSKRLWDRRVAIVSTLYEIVMGESSSILKLASDHLYDSEDLIQKATGWMLREMGKRCSEKTLCDFLDQHASTMPRTTLRYAIERLPEKKRKYYMEL